MLLDDGCGLSCPNHEDGRRKPLRHASDGFTDGLCDCKHHRLGCCLGREASPVKYGVMKASPSMQTRFGKRFDMRPSKTKMAGGKQ